MMNRDNVFENYAEEYDEWFNVHPSVYQAELRAIKMLLPQSGKGVEIGVGTGRFAVPLGITIGVEPSEAMAAIAKNRGITIYEAKAENLPLGDNAFDFVLLITTICFLENPLQALKEIRRILRPAGKIIIGMLDNNSPLGREYESKKKSSKFYRHATFFSVNQVVAWLKQFGYGHIQMIQTIVNKPKDIKGIEPVKEGYGEGLFVVISAQAEK
jgi:ubiquinone/menaquinone biosynthesis C-methylase UbiE